MATIDFEEVLLKELVILDHEPFKNKEDAFRFLSQQLKDAGIVSDQEAFFEALEQRETVGSTYMGGLIALPHGKCAEVIKPGIGFCRCKKPFVYQSNHEEGPVQYIFVLAISESQSGHEYLRVLATLAGYLARDEFIDLLGKAGSYEDIVEGFKKLEQEEEV